MNHFDQQEQGSDGIENQNGEKNDWSELLVDKELRSASPKQHNQESEPTFEAGFEESLLDANIISPIPIESVLNVKPEIQEKNDGPLPLSPEIFVQQYC